MLWPARCGALTRLCSLSGAKKCIAKWRNCCIGTSRCHVSFWLACIGRPANTRRNTQAKTQACIGASERQGTNSGKKGTNIGDKGTNIGDKGTNSGKKGTNIGDKGFQLYAYVHTSRDASCVMRPEAIRGAAAGEKNHKHRKGCSCTIHIHVTHYICI
jgi:hypothetical protein